jgi:parallel beta-helix repeat protein
MITGSAIMDNDYGIVITGSIGGNIMNNTVTGNHNNGINIEDSSGNSVYMNKVSGDQYGITLTGSSVSNVIYMNALQGNSGANGLGNGQLNNWNSTVPITYGYGGKQFSNYLGNYWDNLAGTDANNDGILDTTMALAVNNVDHNPMAMALPDSPTANFTADSTSGHVPMPVQFTDQSLGYPVSWHWDFGDGGTSDMQDPAHIYQNNGQYTVSLTVKNVHGEGHLIRSNYIVVSSATPTAQSTANPTFTVAPPTATPTQAPTMKPTGTALPTPSAKPSPGMGTEIFFAAGLLAYALLANRKNR